MNVTNAFAVTFYVDSISNTTALHTIEVENGSLAWAATRANITATGEWIRVPKFENTGPEFPRDEHHHIIEITSGDHN